MLEFISECHTVPAYKEVSLKVFNSWVTFELPVQESALLVGLSSVYRYYLVLFRCGLLIPFLINMILTCTGVIYFIINSKSG